MIITIGRQHGSSGREIARLLAKELGINLIDADHFCTENVVIPVLQEKLQRQFPDVTFTVSQVLHQTAQTYCP